MITYTESSSTVATMTVSIAGNPGGTQLTATVTGGTGPYTYTFSQAQNLPNIHNTGPMTQTAGVQAGNVLAVTLSPIDPLGSGVLWECVVVDSLGNRCQGYYINLVGI